MAGQEKASPQPRRGWHKELPRSTKTPGSGWLWKVVWLTALFLVLAGIVIGIVAFLPKPFTVPFFVTLSLSAYEDPALPAPPFAQRDAEALFQAFSPQEVDRPSTSQLEESFTRELDRLRSRNDPSLVVYLCALARVKEGQVYVLPGDARLDDFPRKAKPLSEVFLALRECPSPQKMLILDISHPLADPFRGILADDVASHVQLAYEKANVPNLCVLAACSPGEVSLASEELRRSVFAYYVERGLRGEADGILNEPNGRVTVQELAQYVKGQVSRWAKGNRATGQNPVLLAPANFDFPLMNCDRNALEAASLPEPTPYPDLLRKNWHKRDQWAAAGQELLPAQFLRLENLLWRAEQRWRGGTSENTLDKDLKGPLQDFESELAKAQGEVVRPAKPRSLALAARQNHFQMDGDLQKLAAIFLQQGGTPPNPADKAKEEQNKALQASFWEKIKGKSAAETAWLLLTVVQENPDLDRNRLHFLNDLINEVYQKQQQPQEDSPHVETVYLSRLLLLENNDFCRENWPKESVSQAFRCAWLMEAAANVDPRVFPFVQEELQTVAARRRKAEEVLFFDNVEAKHQAKDELARVARQLEDIRQKADVAAMALAEQGKALAFLPSLMPFLEAQRGPNSSRLGEDWQRALQLAVELGHLLDKPTTSSSSDLASASRDLQEAVQLLRDNFQPERLAKQVEDLSKKDDLPPGSAGLIGQIDACLATTLLNSEQREALWVGRHNLARNLFEATPPKEQPGGHQDSPTSPSSNLPEKEEYCQGLRRGILARDLLGLGEIPLGSGSLGSLGKKAECDKASQATVETLGKEIRKAWAEEAPGALVQRLDKKEILAAEQIIRILYAPGTGGKEAPAGSGTSPVLDLRDLRREQATNMWRWLANHYHQEAEAAKKAEAPSASSFYYKAEEEYKLSP